MTARVRRGRGINSWKWKRHFASIKFHRADMTDTGIRNRRSLESGDLGNKILARNVRESCDCHDEKKKKNKKIASEINSTKLRWCGTSGVFLIDENRTRGRSGSSRADRSKLYLSLSDVAEAISLYLERPANRKPGSSRVECRAAARSKVACSREPFDCPFAASLCATRLRAR